jgi:hypothetical protein
MMPLEPIALAVGVFGSLWTGSRLARREWLGAAVPLPALIGAALVTPSILTGVTLLVSAAAGYLAQRFLALSS